MFVEYDRRPASIPLLIFWKTAVRHRMMLIPERMRTQVTMVTSTGKVPSFFERSERERYRVGLDSRVDGRAMWCIHGSPTGVQTTKSSEIACSSFGVDMSATIGVAMGCDPLWGSHRGSRKMHWKPGS